MKPGKPPDTNTTKSREVFPPAYTSWSYRNDRGTLSVGFFTLANVKIPEASGPDKGEVIWIKVLTWENKSCIVRSFHMPHHLKAHLDCLDRSLQKITVKKDCHIILCGIFNCPDIDSDTCTISPCASDRQVQQQLADLFTRRKTCQH